MNLNEINSANSWQTTWVVKRLLAFTQSDCNPFSLCLFVAIYLSLVFLFLVRCIFFFRDWLVLCRRRARKAVHEWQRLSARWLTTVPPSRRQRILMRPTKPRPRLNWAHWPVSTSPACRTFLASSSSSVLRGSLERPASSRDFSLSRCAAPA